MGRAEAAGSGTKLFMNLKCGTGKATQDRVVEAWWAARTLGAPALWPALGRTWMVSSRPFPHLDFSLVATWKLL